MGCTYKTCTDRYGNRDSYHADWALDIGDNNGGDQACPPNTSDPSKCKGKAIYAAGAGKVVDVTTNGRCGGVNPRGISVKIDHGNGTFSHYLHMSRKVVGKEFVDAGQKIGEIGDTGDTGDSDCGYHHLHFEVTDSEYSATGVEIGDLYACDGDTVLRFPYDLRREGTGEKLKMNSWTVFGSHVYKGKSTGIGCT